MRFVKERNMVQAMSLLEKQQQDVPALFKVVALPKGGKVKMTRGQLKELRHHPDELTVTLPEVAEQAAFSLRVKRPLHEREDLVVPSDEDVIDKIVFFLRNEGYEQSQKRARTDLLAGIIRRQSSKYPYQYIYMNSNGKTSRHFATSLGNARLGLEDGAS